MWSPDANIYIEDSHSMCVSIMFSPPIIMDGLQMKHDGNKSH